MTVVKKCHIYVYIEFELKSSSCKFKFIGLMLTETK